jgi:hypothetical protein
MEMPIVGGNLPLAKDGAAIRATSPVRGATKKPFADCLALAVAMWGSTLAALLGSKRLEGSPGVLRRSAARTREREAEMQQEKV